MTTTTEKFSHWQIDGDHYSHPDLSHHGYEILLGDYRTAEDLSRWVLHVGRKICVTKQDLIQMFVRFQGANRG